MKTYKKLISLFSCMLLMIACNDFEEINNDPTKVGEEKIKSHFLLNRSIVEAQQNPHIAERIFVIQWKSGARYERRSNIAIGANYDEYNSYYLSTDYGVGWLNDANMAINVAEKRIAEKTTNTYENNVLQMARIWRAYLVSELADCFGSIPPVNKYDGIIEYKSVEEIYDFILQELKEAVQAIEKDDDMSELKERGTDKIFNADMEKWIKYANSLRLRFAIRISGVKPTEAKAIVEELVRDNRLITELADMASVMEVDGYNPLTGVMSRSWNAQPLSATLNNLMIGLGGIDFQVPDAISKDVKLQDARQYLGRYLPNHLSAKTNDPAAGYFFDALPAVIDPRATMLFNIPGYDDGVHYSSYIGAPATEALLNQNPNVTDQVNYPMTLKTKYTWNTWVAGKWDILSTISSDLLANKNLPCLSKTYRMNTNNRIFFAPWETFFLLAEAGLLGWDVGSAKDHYEKGISLSFDYHGLGKFTDQYINSIEYNRIGTSVAFNHTTEAKSYTVNYIDGYTNQPATKEYQYPKNSIYKNGTVNNDQLTKVITQKYLAQMPYLALEAWNDHRRLGLPFFENPAAEINYTPTNYEIPLTTTNYRECKWEFYQERFKYPESFRINSPESYRNAVNLLGGDDDIYVPLWWTGRKKGN